MRVIISARPQKGAIRADRAWSFFCGATKRLGADRGYWSFANWLWDELGEAVGSLNADAGRQLRVTLPRLSEEALDFVLRLLSFWAEDVRLQRGRSSSENLWRKPVINLFDDRGRRGAERALVRDFSDAGSKELNLMPLLGPGRAFFSLQLIEKGDSTTRVHSHSAVDEYYLTLAGRGTLRFNGKSVPVGPGDLIAKPTGPDAATHLNADRGDSLRLLDMEVWHEPFKGSGWTSKDLLLWPDHDEILMRGPGWNAVLSREALLPTRDTEEHWSEAYRRTRDGARAPPNPPRGRRKRRS